MKHRLVLSLFITSFFAMVSLISLESFQQPAKTEPQSLGEFIYSVKLDKTKDPKQVQTGWFDEFIEPEQNDSLFGKLFRMVLNKKIVVFNPSYPFDRPLAADSAIQLIRKEDTVEVEDPYNPDVLQMVAVLSEVQPEDVINIIFHEEWFYDRATLTLTKNVKGIIPVIARRNVQTGLIDGATPLFYIPFRKTEFQQPDFQLDEISYDYSTDTSFLSHQGWYANVLPGDKKKTQDIAAEGLMQSLKSTCHDKKTLINSPVYPYDKPLERKDRASVTVSIDSAAIMRFSEDWTADLSTMSFTKHVHNVIFGDEKHLVIPSGDEAGDVYQMNYYASVPVNGYVYQRSNSPVQIDRISYGANYQLNSSYRYPVFETRDSSAIAGMLTNICERARSMKMPVYDVNYLYDYAWDKNQEPLTAAGVEGIFSYQETIGIVSPENLSVVKDTLMTFYRSPDEFCGFSFYETWAFDLAGLTFRKNVYAIAPARFVSDGISEVLGIKDAFAYHPPVVNHDSIMQPKYLVAKNIKTPVLVNENELNGSEDDYGKSIFGYSTNERENIQPSQRYKMIQPIIEQIQAGKVIAWHADDVNKKYPVDEFNTMLDTVMARNGIYDRAFVYAGFNELTFDEDWYYNPSTGQFYKQVNAITFGTRMYWQEYGDGSGWKDNDQQYFTIRINPSK